MEIKKKQISFTGIVDKIADELTPQQLKNWQDYVNGIFPTLEETKWARKIADFRLKDWPKGILDSYIAKYFKPGTVEPDKCLPCCDNKPLNP